MSAIGGVEGLRGSPGQVRLRVRIRVWWRRWWLDRELADGRSPGSSRDLSVRAMQLVGAAARREVACSLRRVVLDAERPCESVVWATVPLRRGVIVRWREGLLGLAERLEAREPVNPCGVARARLLVCDGTGPLYNPTPERSFEDALWWIADGLRLCPPHAWDGPVLMKLDPEHAAWTCARCGAVATTSDPAVRPA